MNVLKAEFSNHLHMVLEATHSQGSDLFAFGANDVVTVSATNEFKMGTIAPEICSGDQTFLGEEIHIPINSHEVGAAMAFFAPKEGQDLLAREGHFGRRQNSKNFGPDGSNLKAAGANDVDLFCLH